MLYNNNIKKIPVLQGLLQMHMLLQYRYNVHIKKYISCRQAGGGPAAGPGGLPPSKILPVCQFLSVCTEKPSQILRKHHLSSRSCHWIVL